MYKCTIFLFFENLLAVEAVPNESITLISAATFQSLGTGQGYFNCTCTKKCDIKRYICRKNGYYTILNATISSACTNKDYNFYN